MNQLYFMSLPGSLNRFTHRGSRFAVGGQKTVGQLQADKLSGW